MNNNTNIPIYSIFATCRNRKYYEYEINGNESHSLSLDELYTYIVSLVPEKSKQLYDLIYSFKTFLILIEEKEIKELEFNFEKELENIREKALNNKTKPKIKKISYDDKIKKISEKELDYEKYYDNEFKKRYNINDKNNKELISTENIYKFNK